MRSHANWIEFLKLPRGRREVMGMAGLAALLLAFRPNGAAAQETGGGHTGGGESGGGHGAGRTPGERARRHRQRTGRTLGGGETGGGGHTGGDGGGDNGGTIPPPDGSTTGPIGGGNGGEHFIHEGQGSWGADNKVLRSP
jgi:hypothetical protein